MAPIQRLLITGGCGFIGSNFVRFVLRNRPGWHVTNLDSLSYSGNLENLRDVQHESQYRFVHGSIVHPEVVAPLLADADAVVHLAAESHVDRSIQSARPFVETNVLGTQTLLDAAHVAWQGEEGGRRGRFLQVSSDEVYGSLDDDPSAEPFSEASPLAPSNPYSASKAAADLIATAYRKTYGLDIVITRCSNNFGPYQFPEKIIPLFVTNLIEGRPVPLYGDGSQRRDWLHVEDHCEALLAVLERGRAGQIYNIGADNEHTNLQLSRNIVEFLGKDESQIQTVRDRPAHDNRYAMNWSKIRDELGWRPKQSGWPSALDETLRWYVENPWWWKQIHRGR